MSLLSHLAHNIRVARKGRGHTQESLARALDISTRAVGQWESGRTIPSRKNLEALATELEREPEWFYAHHPDPVEAVA